MHRYIYMLFLVVTAFMASAWAEVTEQEAELLFVQTARTITFDEGTLTLKEVAPVMLFASDRPHRIAGHMTTADFLKDWSTGNDSLAADPPNATLSIFGGEEVVDVVMVLSNPRMKGVDLVYDVRVLDGEPPPTGEGSTLFIDVIGRPLTPLSFAGVARSVARRTIRQEGHYGPHVVYGPASLY